MQQTLLIGIAWIVLSSMMLPRVAEAVTIQDQSGLSVTFAPTGQITDLSVGGVALVNTGVFSGIQIDDMAAVQSGNLLTNGSFESWPDTGLYQYAANYPSSSITRVSSSPAAQDGSRCLKFTGGGSFEISKPLTAFAPYTSYIMTAWIYPSSNSGNFHIQAGLQDWTWNGMNNQYAQDSFTKGQWNKIQITYTTGANPSTLLMDFLVTGTTTGYIAIDNIVVTVATSAQITGTVTQTADTVTLTSQGDPLGLQVTAQIKTMGNYLAMNINIHDTTGRDRAIRASVVLNLNDMGWIWCNDLNSNYPAEVNVWNMNRGTYGGHAQSTYPFGAIATAGGTGLAIGWPMAHPRFYTQSFTRQADGTGNFLLSADLGLAPETLKFPSRADFDVILYAFNGQQQFRGALSKYYQIFPEPFETSFDKQGLWALWLGDGVETLAKNAGVLYHEAEFDLSADGGAGTLLRDDQWGFMSFQYTEPWGYWYPLPAGFKAQYTNPNITPEPHEVVLDQTALYNYIAGDVGSPVPSDRFPGVTRGAVAQAIINTAAWRDPSGNWMCHIYIPGGFAWGTDRAGWDSFVPIANPDPDLPHPNRWDIAWEGQVNYVANAGQNAGGHLDGVFVDSMVFGMALDRMDFCRDHWKVADIPLTFATLPDGRAVPAQALMLADVEYLQKLKQECGAKGWATLGNGFYPVYAPTAAWLDILGAGEISANSDGTVQTIDQTIQGYFRAMAYRKPVSVMDYSLSLFGLASTQENVDNIIEPRINHNLFYGIYPGTANCWRNAPDTLEKLNLVVPVFKKYFPLFQAINAVGWEPVTLATVDQPGVLIERWGRDVNTGLYFTVFNSTDIAVTPRITVDLTGMTIDKVCVRELVAGTTLPVTGSGTGVSFSPTIGPKRTVLISLKPDMTGMNGNLIINGSFEAQTAGWYLYADNYPASEIGLETQTPPAFDGANCIKARGSGFMEIAQTASGVLPNTTYALTAWLYPLATCPDGVLVQAGFQGLNMVNYYVGGALVKGQWNEIKILYTTGAAAPALNADFMIWSSTADAAIAFDRIKVATVPTPDQNASFDVPAGYSITLDGNLSDWPASSAWSEPYIFWNQAGLTSTSKAKFAWNDTADLLYVAVQTNESSVKPGGHVVIGIAADKDNEAYTGLGATQLAFDFKPATGAVTVMNEINYYNAKYAAGWPGAASGITGVTAACRAGGGVYTYEIAIPLWTDWNVMTQKKALSAGDKVYVYAIVESALESGNGTDMTYNGNPGFAFENGFLAAAILTLQAGTRRPGDANGDNKVDVSDLGILAANYGITSGATWAMGDFNNDGKVDVSDLGILAANYGVGTGGSPDFNQDALALGLSLGDGVQETDKDDAPVISTLDCGSAGLPLIAGIILAAMVLLNYSKLKE